MIHKELLGTLLNIEVDKNSLNELEGSIVWVDNTSDIPYVCYSFKGESIEINIHELVHLCKMYAAKNGYIIKSHLKVRDNMEIEGVSYCWGGSYSKYIKMDFSEDTEAEAVIKATEWIFKRKINEI